MKAYARCISMAFCFTLALLMLFSVAHAQQKKAATPRPPTKAQTPTVNCSEAQTSKACKSFKQLLDASDKDVLELLSLPTSYVCFRPTEDAFLLFHLEEPTQYMWQTLEGDAKGQTQYASPVLAEFRDGVVYDTRAVIGAWYRHSPTDKEPLFKIRSDSPFNDGSTLTIDTAELSVQYPFKNQDGGTTQYSLVIRRSTGRFIETFAVENAPTTTHAGTCLIYRYSASAREL